MRRIQLISVGIVGLLISCCTYGQSEQAPAISAKQLEQCQSQRAQDEYAQIDLLISRQQFTKALTLIPKPDLKTPLLVHALFGRIQYLRAYQKVHTYRSKQPDQALLAVATKHILHAANKQHPMALYDKARWFLSEQQHEQRIELLTAAAEQDYVPAMLALAKQSFLTAQNSEQRHQAQVLVQQAATTDGKAKIQLARYYLHDDPLLKSITGYPYDPPKAIELLIQAVQVCEPEAAYRLSKAAQKQIAPIVLPTNKARYWLEVAALLDYIPAYGELAADYLQSGEQIEQAIMWAKRGAEQDDITALVTLADIYYKGKGVEKDHEKALGFYEAALNLDQHNRYVQNQLGIMYYKGEGGQVDFHRAAYLCRGAANTGQAGCQYYLGLMYVNGEGVTQDIALGIDWMKKSAAQDFRTAQNWLRENW